MKKTKEYDIRICGDCSLIVLIGDQNTAAASHKAKWLAGLISELKNVSDVSNVCACENSVTVIYDPCLTSYEYMRSKISRLISKNAKKHIVVIGADDDLPVSGQPAAGQSAPDQSKGGDGK